MKPSLRDIYNFYKVVLCQYLVFWLHWYHKKRGTSPYTKFEYRLRWDNRILPYPLTPFHCVCCRRFTLRNRHKADQRIKVVNWAGFNWNYPTWVYVCNSCQKLGEEHRRDYLKDSQLWKTSPAAEVLKNAF